MTVAPASRSVTVSWDAIHCSQRNGDITGYAVLFQCVNGTVLSDRTVMNQAFMASALTPFTNYSFRVAGVNSEGPGPFSDEIPILTDEEGILPTL